MVTKYSSRLFSQLLDVEDGEMSQTGISITQLRDIYFNKFVHNKKKTKRLYCSMQETWFYEYL